MKNIDRLRLMSKDDIAKIISNNIDCSICKGMSSALNCSHCFKSWADWLEEDYNVDDFVLLLEDM